MTEARMMDDEELAFVVGGVGDGTVRTYRVANGETLYTIARKFGTTVEHLVSLNHLHSTEVRPGTYILVPING